MDEMVNSRIDRMLLETLGINKSNSGTSTGTEWFSTGATSMDSVSPVNGKTIAEVGITSEADYDRVVVASQEAFKTWRMIPAPKRGEIVRQIGEALREKKEPLGRLVSYEMGKSLQEGLGEVQEMIDICDFAVGLSRQLYGLTMHSERLNHRMYEQWHPLGIVGIISAFNFPVAVWSWNAMIAWVCGDVCIWKPSEKVPLCAIACQKIVSEVFNRNGLHEGISNVVTGDYRVGAMLTKDKRVALISATGSIRMGKQVAQAVGARLGKTLLELGGNNAIIVAEHADLDIAIRGIVFGAIGTCGQRCTSTRRVIIHESVYDDVKTRLVKAYEQLHIGNPLDESKHVGPLIDKAAVEHYVHAIERIKQAGGRFVVEGGTLGDEGHESGCYVKPCIAEVENHWDIVQEETFARTFVLHHDNEHARDGNIPLANRQRLRHRERESRHIGSGDWWCLRW